MLSAKGWVLTILGVAATIAALSFAIFWIAGGYDPRPCIGSSSDCLLWQQVLDGRSVLKATTIGLAMSAIGTFALVVTISLSHRATNAAVGALHAADRAVKLAQETASRELRPYMHFDSITKSYNSNDNKEIISWRMNCWWKNSGATVAQNVRSKMMCTITHHRLGEDFHFPDLARNEWAGHCGIDSKFYSTTKYIPNSEIQKVIDGTSKMYGWSWVEYEGHDEKTLYRSEWHGEIVLWDGGAGNRDLRHNTHYLKPFNECDERAFKSRSRRIANGIMNVPKKVEISEALY